MSSTTRKKIKLSKRICNFRENLMRIDWEMRVFIDHARSRFPFLPTRELDKISGEPLPVDNFLSNFCNFAYLSTQWPFPTSFARIHMGVPYVGRIFHGASNGNRLGLCKNHYSVRIMICNFQSKTQRLKVWGRFWLGFIMSIFITFNYLKVKS